MMPAMVASSTGGAQVPVIEDPRIPSQPPSGLRERPADPEALIKEARRRRQRRGRRLGVVVAGALAVAAAGYAMWGGGGGGGEEAARAEAPPPRSAPAQTSTQQTGRVGQPVEDDGMTFVVEKFAVVPSIPIPREHPVRDEQPLKARAGSRLWVLTVRVRNGGEASADPFCRNGHARSVGADVYSRTRNIRWYHSWWDKSVLIEANDKLCGAGI